MSSRGMPVAAMAAPTPASLRYAGSGVDVAVAGLEGVLHDPLGIFRRDLENAEAKLGDGDAVVQCQL